MKTVVAAIALGLVVMQGSVHADNRTVQSTAVTTETRKQAIAEIRKLGGYVETDMDLSDKPVIGIYLTGPNITDAELSHLVPFKKLQTLSLYATRVTDSGLQQIAGLIQGQTLNLEGSALVTDEGLKYLKGLKQLECLSRCENDRARHTARISVTNDVARVMWVSSTQPVPPVPSPAVAARPIPPVRAPAALLIPQSH